MPDPQAHPQVQTILKVARLTLIAGVVIMLLKVGVFWLTRSAAVLSDALESIINIIAAAFLLYSLWFSNRPADKDHPYGHGKIEFMTLGLEGWMILTAGVTIAVVAVKRLITPVPIEELRLELGTWLLGGINLLNGALAGYVLYHGRKYKSPALTADGKHLLTDVASTFGVLIGLILVQFTGWPRLDPLIALIMAGAILLTSWRLLWQSIDGLMDRTNPADDAVIRAILDEEVRSGAIFGYHKVRYRHTGSFHWIDMHLQVNPALTVRQSHDLASRIELRIETKFGQANATAHIEPYEPPVSGNTSVNVAGIASTPAQASAPANSSGQTGAIHDAVDSSEVKKSDGKERDTTLGKS